ncbi:TetR/AcrR family transcriptional regulator [Nocardia sp. NPDC088792]|uniref:TetR/AcrR family transcriptional regulator n=1 Tax=Nocardia sp. NPDC088792 TaxID=3364332 RepID=UPI0037FB558C
MTSVRELNKQRTRAAIADTATRLFLVRGFDKVTIAEVAAAAGVAKMTVTNYFPRKEDLVFDLAEELISGPADTVAARPAGESALHALRRACLEGLERREPALGFAGPEFARMVRESPALTARLREIHEQRESALAAVLAETAGVDPGADDADLTPRIAAAQLDTVRRIVLGEALRRNAAGEDPERIARELSRCAASGFDLLEPALGDYAVRTAE